MDWLQRLDWIAVGTLTFTGLTAAATVYALFQRWRERPRPAWRLAVSWAGFSDSAAPGAYGDVHNSVRATLSNVGDGDAYAVHVALTGCEAYSAGSRLDGWPMVARGEPQEFSVVFDEVDGRHVVEGATLTVEWRQPPRRGKVRSQTFLLADTRPAS